MIFEGRQVGAGGHRVVVTVEETTTNTGMHITNIGKVGMMNITAEMFLLRTLTWILAQCPLLDIPLLHPAHILHILLLWAHMNTDAIGDPIVTLITTRPMTENPVLSLILVIRLQVMKRSITPTVKARRKLPKKRDKQ